MDVIKNNVIKSLDLEFYFQADVTKVAAKFNKCIDQVFDGTISPA